MIGFGAEVIKKAVDKNWNVSKLVHDGTDEIGCIYFSFPAEDLINKKFPEDPTYLIHKEMGTFYADMLGEIIIRKNHMFFLALFMDIPLEDFDKFTMNTSHVHFGLAKENGLILMQFHISLLSRIFFDIFLDKIGE